MKLEDLRFINENVDLDKYIVFREEVKKHMEHPEWLGDFNKEDLVTMLNTGSKIWVYYLDNDPVCSMMLIPADQRSLDKFELKLDYMEVADYGPMFVNPKYVGNGLQYQMLIELDDYCKQLGYKYAAGTIHPDNIFSIRNLVKDDIEYKNTKTFTRGIRNIYVKQY